MCLKFLLIIIYHSSFIFTNLPNSGQRLFLNINSLFYWGCHSKWRSQFELWKLIIRNIKPETWNPKSKSPNFFPGKSIITSSKLKGQNFQYFTTPLGSAPNIHYFASEKKDNVFRPFAISEGVTPSDALAFHPKRTNHPSTPII